MDTPMTLVGALPSWSDTLHWLGVRWGAFLGLAYYPLADMHLDPQAFVGEPIKASRVWCVTP
jgi:hypothetical protein